MPITPLHFGVGALCHASAPRRINFWSFCLGNVLIDCEPLYYLLRGEFPLHRFWHTLGGASLILFATLALWLRIGQIFKRCPRLRDDVSIGLMLGLYSHLLLDSLMHADLHPFAPFSPANPLLNLISTDTLTGLCLLCALLAVVILYRRGVIEL